MTEAVAKLSVLKQQFDAAAKTRTNFFTPWCGPYALPPVPDNEYADYAATLGDALSALQNAQPQQAAAKLNGIKTQFQAQAAAWDEASRGFFASWFADEKRKAAEYTGYVKKIDAIIRTL